MKAENTLPLARQVSRPNEFCHKLTKAKRNTVAVFRVCWILELGLGGWGMLGRC